MISNILSQLFRVGFFITVLFGLMNFAVQVVQKPLQFKTGENSYFRLGQPGINVNAQRHNNFERNAPDSMISYAFRDSNGFAGTSGSISIGEKSFSFLHARLDSLVAAKKSSHEKAVFDTSITIIGQVPAFDQMNELSAGFIINDDSTVLYYPPKGKPVTFPNMKAAELYNMMRGFNPVNHIVQDGWITETLRIRPANGWQRLGFVLYDLARFACLSLLFFFLARLFRNFYKKEFFTQANVRIIKITGWLLFLPSIAAGLLYWIFLVNLHPVKLVFPAELGHSVIANYEIKSNHDWTMIFLGTALLVLAHIFKNGVVLKEADDYTL